MSEQPTTLTTSANRPAPEQVGPHEKEPLFPITGHIFPRFILLAGVFLLPADADRWSIDAWLLSNRRAANPDSGGNVIPK